MTADAQEPSPGMGGGDPSPPPPPPPPENVRFSTEKEKLGPAEKNHLSFPSDKKEKLAFPAEKEKGGLLPSNGDFLEVFSLAERRDGGDGGGVSFDEAMEKINGLGRWQIKVIFVLIIASSTGCHNLAISFIAQTPAEFACGAAELAAVPYDVAVNLSVPMETTPTGKRRRARCVSYADRNYTLARALYDEDRLGEIPEEFYGNESEVACGEKGWRYNVQDGYITATTQWDLVCGKSWLVATAQMLYFAGYLTGCVVFGTVADRIGRRRCMLLVFCLMAVFGSVNAYAPNYSVFALTRFLVGATSMPIPFVYAVEIVTPAYRNAVGNIIQCGFAIAYMALPWLALALQNWRHLQLTISLWVIVVAVIVYVVRSGVSPRWLVCQTTARRNVSSQLSEIARVNQEALPGTTPSESGRGGEADYSKALPMLIFGALAIAASLLALLLPETMDRDLPETIEDGENFDT
ncbi:PREDICTED: organic cation transporter protein-like [Priapulus caudatus]|uniref:Organic cation transporter protein-like n=1 Tax=Priapulus caudatus TaxID=37621 RepID=A0ABM1F1T5_PRICU|nr:PREDICTED: organic cation transporter protein-like [Priapulus caudatus]